MLPKPIKTILKRYNDLAIKKGIEYTDLIRMNKQMAIYGYDFNFFLHCVPYILKKINNEIKNF